METSITINFDIFTNNFTARIWADLIALRVILAAIKDKTYVKHADHDNGGMHVQAQIPTQDQGLIDYEIVKTFISIMRNVNDYLDRMVSILLFSKKQHQIPGAMTLQEVEKHVASELDKELFDYCQHAREEFATKLKHFSALTPEFVRYMTTYNLLRNCYEHHKAISQRGLQIPIKKMGLFTKDGKKVVIGQTIEGGSTITIKFTQKTIAVKKQQAAILSYDDIESMVLYLATVVPGEVANDVAKQLNTKQNPL